MRAGSRFRPSAQRRLVFVFALVSLCAVRSIRGENEERPRPNDLPFDVPESQRLSEKDLKDKPEGWYPLVFPVFAQDQTRGTIYGAGGGIIDNGKRADPLFQYTSFREILLAASAVSTRGWQLHQIAYGNQAFLGTPWSFFLIGWYQKDINALYFGADAATMTPLAYHPRNDPSQPLVTNAPFKEQQKNFEYRRPATSGAPFTPYETDRMYNRYVYEFPFVGALVYRKFGELSLLGGAGSGKYIIRTYDGRIFDSPDPVFGETKIPAINVVVPTPEGRTKVTQDAQNGKIRGLSGGWINSWAVGAQYDTRDLAIDPTRGFVAGIMHERVDRAFGSDYQYNKTFAQLRAYYNPMPRIFDKLVIAGRVAVMETKGDAPFFKYAEFYTSDLNTALFSGLGGSQSLHAYENPRFVGPVMALTAAEIRWKMGSSRAFGYFIDWILVPFSEAGRVWDRQKELSLKGYAISNGVGIRIAINKSFVLASAFAVSREEKTFNFGLGHPF